MKKFELPARLLTAALNSCLRLLNRFIYICKLSRILKAKQNAICTSSCALEYLRRQKLRKARIQSRILRIFSDFLFQSDGT